MRVALKEWAVVIDAMARGRQAILLRKGGITEGSRGFELLHREFLLYPTWEHQQAGLIREEFREDFERARPEGEDVVVVQHMARVAAVHEAPQSPEAPAAMEEFHIWNERFIGLRYEYRPDLPLYLVVIRAYRLARPMEIPRDPRYGGCRSWVELNEEVDTRGAEPILTDSELERAMRMFTETRDAEGT